MSSEYPRPTRCLDCEKESGISGSGKLQLCDYHLGYRHGWDDGKMFGFDAGRESAK